MEPVRPMVLYIEDDDAIWKLVHKRLRDRWLLVRASNDAEACVLMRQLGDEMAALVTDLNLAGSTLSGVELIQLARGSLPADKTPAWARNIAPPKDLPVIVLSGSEPHVLRARGVGATKVLLKPIDFQALEQALTSTIASRAAPASTGGGVTPPRSR